MTTYTDADVARLVTAATAFTDFYTRGNAGIFPGSLMANDLACALIPFRPDPEDALVTKMAWRYCESVGGTTEGIVEVKKAMKDVLAVVKKQGLPE